MKNELADMTVKELRSHAKEVAKEIARREGERLSRARESLGKKAREIGISIEGLFGKNSKSKPETTKSNYSIWPTTSPGPCQLSRPGFRPCRDAL